MLIAQAQRIDLSMFCADEQAYPMLLLRREDLSRLSPATSTIPQMVRALLSAQAARDLPQRSSDAFVTPVIDDQRKQRAIKGLLKTNWRPHDGIVARLINKHISVIISQLLANSPVSPNQMTAFAAVLALIGVGFAAWGSATTFFIGATLFQIQSILDGCDGELARMRYQSSNFGAWFDTVVDDVLGILWVSALGLGAYRASGELLYLILGIAAAAFHFVSTGMVYVALIKAGAHSHSEYKWWFEEGEQAPDAYPDLSKVSTWGKYVVRRDFYVLLFWVLSLFGLLKASMFCAFAGATGLIIVALIQLSKRGLKVTR